MNDSSELTGYVGPESVHEKIDFFERKLGEAQNYRMINIALILNQYHGKILFFENKINRLLKRRPSGSWSS